MESFGAKQRNQVESEFAATYGIAREYVVVHSVVAASIKVNLMIVPGPFHNPSAVAAQLEQDILDEKNVIPSVKVLDVTVITPIWHERAVVR